MRVLFIDIDTMRADRLGCYGYNRDTSPNMDSIAEQGVRFNNYHCSDAPCLPSRAALINGRFGIHTGIVNHGGTAADLRAQGSERGFRSAFSYNSLGYIFRRAGYYPVSISPFAERHSAWWFNAGFRETYDTGKGGSESAEEITPLVMDWLGRNAKRDNWFLHVNYWDPHTQYRAPAEFGNMFRDAPLPEWYGEKTLKHHRENVPGAHSACEIMMYDSKPDPKYPRQPGEVNSMADFRKMIDGYDCGIRYVDSHVGMILSELEKQGVLEDTAVIVTSDHGENMGELGIYAEHATADQATTRIPMIVKWPGMKKGRVDDGLHYNLDFAPTAAELLGISPWEEWDGRSYKASLEGGESGREYLVIGQCAHGCQRSVRFGDWLYIRTYHDGFRLFPEEMLYNVARDPHETEDLAKKNPDVCKKAGRILEDWHAEMMKTMDGTEDPLQTSLRERPLHVKGRLKDYLKRLEATGRGKLAEKLRKKYPEEL